MEHNPSVVFVIFTQVLCNCSSIFKVVCNILQQCMQHSFMIKMALTVKYTAWPSLIWSTLYYIGWVVVRTCMQERVFRAMIRELCNIDKEAQHDTKQL